ncbi:TAXI family TRAP transporter solute-binding subunit [Micromonospora echinofusca]|uniref:TAXI family TRAP transporter solute-binding subunit n=1 Tax=Micromonospora echinofusca TaxID=47858 RepID=A0ABS3W0Q8_MICEH|nr:TAXI family TRAP transporter solute-binding subunit [Micromonospora echinofusca]MBO4210372.1 TAXI family TRAP transporter solute-binding subunit [Micromonospora echinofusca]
MTHGPRVPPGYPTTGRPRRLHRLPALLAALVATVLLAGCGAGAPDPAADAWHGGRIFLATGNTTGVYYQLGGGYADIISRHLPGYEARAEPTGASGENITRVAGGDMEIAFSLADTAADASAGRGAFQGRPQAVRALARVYRNYTQVIVRTDAKIRTMADLRGKRVSTGSPKSGTDVLAGRLLTAAGLDPERGIRRLRLSLPETAKRMRAGSLDAMFFSGGLPTPGIADLLAAAPGTFTFLPIANLIEPLTAAYGPVYTTAELPKEAYGTPAGVPTITVANLILVSADMPDRLAYDLTALLFSHQTELAAVHPEGRNFDKQSAAGTDPIPLHPGAARYYRGG